MPEHSTLLIVDDDPLIQDVLGAFFEEHFNVVGAMNLQNVKSALTQLPQPPQFALVDLGLPPTPHQPTQGFAVLSILQAQAPECAIVVVSGQDVRRHGQRARALGATEYVEKPCAPESLLEKLRLAQEIKLSECTTHGFVGGSQPLVTLREQIALIAPVAFSVLIEGESGVGKELVARALHDAARRGKPFLAVNCAAIPEHLVEPILFGNVKGAYTGATHDNAGYLGDAADGTLLLDEVADLPDSIQPKLLRVLETGEYRRVGETQPRQCSARIIAASNRSQQRGNTAAGRIRDDLYYRLSVFTIAVPPLRQLGDDRFLLLEHFRQLIAQDLQASPFTLSEAAMKIWAVYDFPGNVRELKNVIARLQVKYGGQQVDEPQLRGELCTDAGVGGHHAPGAEGFSQAVADEARTAAERLASHQAKETLAECGGDVMQAAQRLNIGEPVFRFLLTLPS